MPRRVSVYCIDIDTDIDFVDGMDFRLLVSKRPFQLSNNNLILRFTPIQFLGTNSSLTNLNVRIATRERKGSLVLYITSFHCA